MDFYSGSDGSNYNGNNNNYNGNEVYDNGKGFLDIVKDWSSVILIIIAMIIVMLISIFLLSMESSSSSYNTKDTNTNLKTLTVSDGTLSPKFSSSVKEYTLTVSSDVQYVTFSCTSESIKAKITGCDEEVSITKNKTPYEIRVDAEDTSVARYNITIIREN